MVSYPLSKRDGLRANEIFLREESPGSIEQGCRLTAGGGDSKDSATENKRFPREVSVEMCGKSAHGDR